MRHALDCGLHCGLAECDCGVERIYGLASLIPEMWPSRLPVTHAQCIDIATRAYKAVEEFCGPFEKHGRAVMLRMLVSRMKPDWSDCS